MADKEHRDTNNPSLNPEQLVWIDNIISAARPQQAIALAPACRMFTHPHQFQRCSFYSLLCHNQVRGVGVVWVNTYQKIIAKPDGLVYMPFCLVVIMSACTPAPTSADSLQWAGSTSNTRTLEAEEHP